MTMQSGLDITAILRASKLPQQIQLELADFALKTAMRPQRSVRRKNVIGAKTVEARMYGVISATKTLIAIGFAIKSLHSVGERHIAALHAAWTQRGGTHELSSGRIHNLNTHLRLLFETHFKKHGLVRHVNEYSETCIRTYATTTDKSWQAKGVDVAEVLRQIKLDTNSGAVVAAQLQLAWAFGLRVEEAWLARPCQMLDEAINREVLRIVHGTKGGRSREVPITDAIQIHVLASVGELARGENSTMIPLTHTLPQWKSRFYSVVRHHGIRRDTENGGLGVTAHGLRHQYLHSVYKLLAGQDAPVKLPTHFSLDAHRSALKTIVEIAGHSDTRKADAYLGSATSLRRMHRLRHALSSAQLDSDAANVSLCKTAGGEL